MKTSYHRQLDRAEYALLLLASAFFGGCLALAIWIGQSLN